MIKILYDYLPVVIFYITFKKYGIYMACKVIIATCFLQMVYDRIKNKKWSKMLVTFFFLALIFAGSTILLHDPEYIKWKLSIAYWSLGVICCGSLFIGKGSILKSFLKGKVEMPSKNWVYLTLAWSLFFIALGFVNLYIIKHYDTNFWVNFKLFGTLGSTLAFLLIQAPFLAKYVIEDDKKDQDKGDSC